jgi:hypothetical protein
VSNTCSGETHAANLVRGNFPYACSCQAVITPLVVVSQVVGRLQSSNGSIVVAHIVTGCVHLGRHKAIPLVIVVVDTVGCCECQALEEIELQINVTCNHGTLTVVFSTMENTVRVVLDVIVWVFIILTVCIHHLHSRRVVQTNPDRVRLVLGETCTRVVSLREVDIGCHFQPVENLVVHVSLDSVTSRLGINDNTLLVHYVGREVSLCLVITLSQRNLVVLGNTSLEQFVHPVDTSLCAIQIILNCALRNTLVVYQSLSILLGAHYFRNMVSIRKTEAAVESNLSSTSFTALGLYHYNTIRTTCTIDCGRRSVLQNLDALDILRADTLKTCLANNTIYYVEGALLLLTELAPRTRIFIAPPGTPLDITCTPDIRPLRASSTRATG